MLSPPAAHRILLARNETFKVQLQRGKKCLYVSLNSSGHGEGGHMHSYCETLCSARFIVTRQLDERGVLMEHKGVVCFYILFFPFLQTFVLSLFHALEMEKPGTLAQRRNVSFILIFSSFSSDENF